MCAHLPLHRAAHEIYFASENCYGHSTDDDNEDDGDNSKYFFHFIYEGTDERAWSPRPLWDASTWGAAHI